MITKIILTLLVIIGAMWFASSQRGEPKQRVLVVATRQEQQKRQMLRRGAYIFMAIMIIAAVAMISLELSDNYATVTVHVINTQSGARSSYQARREDIKGSSFTTLDGRNVYVAGIERIEVEATD
jgi:hypothetical protein